MSGKGVPIYKERGFALLFLNIPRKCNNLVSQTPNYFIFIGYLKTGAGRGFLNPLWIHHCYAPLKARTRRYR